MFSAEDAGHYIWMNGNRVVFLHPALKPSGVCVTRHATAFAPSEIIEATKRRKKIMAREDIDKFYGYKKRKAFRHSDVDVRR